jgi:hypothetical protein
VREIYQPCDETYQMIEIVYGLTRSDLAKYQGLLAQVSSTPCIVDFYPLHQAMVIDGVQNDGQELYQIDRPISDIEEVDVEAFNRIIDLYRLSVKTVVPDLDEEKYPCASAADSSFQGEACADWSNGY